MEQTFQALGGVLLKSIPTVCLLLLLYFYLKAMLFRPLDRILKQRGDLTEGARQAAEQSLSAADRKQQEYEAKFRDARAEVYRAQEEIRRQWLEDQAAQLAEAQQRSQGSVHAAREQVAADTVAARQTLSETSAVLADEIAAAVLARKVRATT
jgi:F-type H+-transporting ATPase subunit b